MRDVRFTNSGFVSNGILGGALGTTLAWAIEVAWGIPVPTPVAGALAVIFGALVGSLGADAS